MHQAVDQGHVRAQAVLHRDVRQVGHLDPARVGHDELGAVGPAPHHPFGGDGMGLGGVGADDEDGVGSWPTPGRELVMAPEPKAAARPTTVELCQSRAQWSTLLVPMAARASFWIR